MADGRVLIAGCGDLGTRLGLRLVAAGRRVTGLRRNAGLLPAAFERASADMRDVDALRAALRGDFTDVVVCSAAPGFDEAAYRATYVDALRNLLELIGPAPRWWLVSSTSVYHQDGGEWVDEDSPTLPRGFSGRILLEAEQLLRDRAGARATVLRLAGIYGPGRERLLSEVRAGIGVPREPVRYGNRIHIEDCAGVLEFLLARAASGAAMAPLWLGVDCEPASYHEVRHWIAGRLGVALDDAAGSASSMRGAGNKRCSNARLRAAGYRFAFPDYRAGYGALLDAAAAN